MKSKLILWRGIAIASVLVFVNRAEADFRAVGLPNGMNAVAIGKSGLRLTIPKTTDGFVKVLITGKISSNGTDHRLLLQINPNGPDHWYQSFVVMDGNAGMGEWDGSGIYLGRTGWGLDSSFSAEVTVAVHPGSNRITTSGMATFGMANNTILGYHNNGFLVTDAAVTNLDFVFSSPGNAVVDATLKAVVY
jgi:hypothetical protein